MRYTINLTANVPLKQVFKGRCVVVWDTGAAAEVDLTLYGSNLQQPESFGAVGNKTTIYSEQVEFTAAELVSTVNTTVELLVTPFKLDALDGANLTVTLAPAQIPLSVETTRGDAPGNPFFVSGLVLGDTPAASIVDDAAVAVTAAGAVLLAANAARLEVRFTNIGNDAVALGAPGITWAKRCVILNPGDSWVETRGAALAWSAITDAGATASVTMQELRA